MQAGYSGTNMRKTYTYDSDGRFCGKGNKQEVIEALESRVQKEREELQALINEQRMARLESLEELIDSSNLSLDEVSEIIKQHVESAGEGAA